MKPTCKVNRLHTVRWRYAVVSGLITLMLMPEMATADGVIGLPQVDIGGQRGGSQGGGGGGGSGGGGEPGSFSSSAAEQNEPLTDLARINKSDGCALTAKGPDGKDVNVTINSPVALRRQAATAAFNGYRRQLNAGAFRERYPQDIGGFVVTYSDGTRELWTVESASAGTLSSEPVHAKEAASRSEARENVQACGPFVAVNPNP
jgi:hypothetical protein